MSRQDWRSRRTDRVPPLDHEDWRRLARTLADDHCHGLVLRDGEQDACGKPPVAVIDGRGSEDVSFWPACAYHAHRYGGPSCVPLSVLLLSLRPSVEAS